MDNNKHELLWDNLPFMDLISLGISPTEHWTSSSDAPEEPLWGNSISILSIECSFGQPRMRKVLNYQRGSKGGSGDGEGLGGAQGTGGA